MACVPMEDCLAHRTVEFEKWSQLYQWKWDNGNGCSKIVPKSLGAIQHSCQQASLIQDGEHENPVSKTNRASYKWMVSKPATSHHDPTAPPPLSPSSSRQLYSSAHKILDLSPPLADDVGVLYKTEKFEVKRTPTKGYASFATKDIEVGELVISESPLLKATERDFHFRYESLNREDQEEFNGLYGWSELSDDPLMAKFMTNRFRVGGDRSLSGVFPKSSRFNHACPPVRSCSYKFNCAKNQLEVIALMPIRKGDEITISYTTEPESLYDDYGFHCDCSVCHIPVDHTFTMKDGQTASL